MKCKICGGEIKPGALECQYCGNTDFVPEMFSEDEFEAEKRSAPPREAKPLYKDLTGDETVVVRNTKPMRERFCRKCGRELNPNGKCRVCDNDYIERPRPAVKKEPEELSGRKNKKPQKEKMNPVIKIMLIIFLLLVLFAISYMIFFNWMKSLSEQEQAKPTETPAVVTEVPIDDSSDKARWEPTNTSVPVVSTPQPAPTPSLQKAVKAPTPTQVATSAPKATDAPVVSTNETTKNETPKTETDDNTDNSNESTP